MKFNIYYDTDKKYLIKANVTQENTRRYLKTLSVAEKTHIFLEPVNEKYIEEDEEER